MQRLFLLVALSTGYLAAIAQPANVNNYNILWNSQSENSAASMPVGGGSIGGNLWVENDEVLLYFSKSGAFDENNTFLKSGRLRLKLSPNPFTNATFKQQLHLKTGTAIVSASGKNHHTLIKVWMDIFNPVIHIEIQSSKPTTVEAVYENWRFTDRVQAGKENNANSWKWAKHVPVITKKDSISFENNTVLFYHRNTDSTVFDASVAQQGLTPLKAKLFDPLKLLTSGGLLKGNNFIVNKTAEGQYINTPFKSWSLQSRRAAKNHRLQIVLHNNQTPSIQQWISELKLLAAKSAPVASVKKNNLQWWREFWARSYIQINPEKGIADSGWQISRNYHLFRYMLAANAYGAYPTKFNGGLFTVDPVFTDTSIKGTPDHRNWGGGTFTAQNQRLVYWPMLKNGDADMMKPQFEFYNRLLKTAELRSKFYWGHKGANFNEQIENFGLPNPTEYGWKRPKDFDAGVEYNAWLEYEWDTVLEFCLMMMEANSYGGKSVNEYLPLIKSCLIFFDEHYQYQAGKLSNKALDQKGQLVLYPGSGAETFKMAYNASSTIAALKVVTQKLLSLKDNVLSKEEREYFNTFLKRIPPIPFTTVYGKPTIAPAQAWARVNNVESSMLYPIYPWGIFGIGRPGIDTAINTYRLDTFALKFRSYIGWKQDNIFAARLGLKEDAKKFTILKLKNSNQRFPAFWGPGFDWMPDHNWGGTGMIGLQEMLLQAVDDKIYLFPAWPETWDVHFRLHAPKNTIVEGTYKKGKLIHLHVNPASRKMDIVNML